MSQMVKIASPVSFLPDSKLDIRVHDTLILHTIVVNEAKTIKPMGIRSPIQLDKKGKKKNLLLL